MRKISILFGALASLGLMLGLSWTIATSEAHATDWRYETGGGWPCGSLCGDYDPYMGCWCYKMDPIIVT